MNGYWKNMSHFLITSFLKKNNITQEAAGKILGISQSSFANKLSRGSIRLDETLFLIDSLLCDLTIEDWTGNTVVILSDLQKRLEALQVDDMLNETQKALLGIDIEIRKLEKVREQLIKQKKETKKK